MVVDGVGAVELLVPPEDVVYHRRPTPDADKGTALSYWQYFIKGTETTGESEVYFTTTDLVILSAPQALLDATSLTL